MSFQANYEPVPYYAQTPAPYPGRPDFNHSSSSYNYSQPAKDNAPPTFTSSSPSLSPSQARQQAEKEASALSIVLFSLAVFTAIIAPVALLLLLIFVFNTSERDGLAVKTSADLQNLLTISQIITTIVSKSVPIVIAVHAYQLAAQWLKASDRRSDGRPTPLQLGMLLSVLQGANIMAWIKVRWHLFRGSKEAKRQVVQTSPILKRAVAVLGFLLVLSNVIVGLDTWLHVSSKAATMARVSPYSGSSLPMYGKQRNDTACAAALQADPTYGTSCYMTMSADDAFGMSRPEGLQTLTNTSAKNMAVMTDDGMLALMAPASIQSNLAYEATTSGIGSTCMSLTKACLKPTVSSYDGSYIYGDNYFPYLDCTDVSPRVNVSMAAGLASGYTSDTLPFGFVYPSNGSFTDSSGFAYDHVTTNPFNIAAVILSFAFDLESGDDYFVNNTGFFKHGRTGSWNVVYCNTTVYDVKYRYIPSSTGVGGSYTALSATPADTRMAWLVSIGFTMGFIQKYMPSRIEGVGMRAGDYITSFSQQLSREMMALSAALYEPVPVTAVVESNYSLGSRVQMVPLAVYLAAVIIYALATLIIGITALLESRSVKFVRQVQLRITTSLPIVHALFGPVECARTWKSDGLEMFSTESESDRLYVGPVKTQTEGDSFGFARAG